MLVQDTLQDHCHEGNISTIKPEGGSIIQCCILWKVCPLQPIQQGKSVLKGLTQAIKVFRPEVTLVTCFHSPLARTYDKALPNYKETR